MNLGRVLLGLAVLHDVGGVEEDWKRMGPGRFVGGRVGELGEDRAW